mgnify:CR=1 FL=1
MYQSKASVMTPLKRLIDFRLVQFSTFIMPLFSLYWVLNMCVNFNIEQVILFVFLELQALCFLVLFAWNRRNEKAINATLKFAVVNFIASTLILLGFIEIILYFIIDFFCLKYK